MGRLAFSAAALSQYTWLLNLICARCGPWHTRLTQLRDFAPNNRAAFGSGQIGAIYADVEARLLEFLFHVELASLHERK